MKFFMKLKLNKTIRAFTLVETLTAIIIISTVILGPLTVAMNSSSYARQTKDTMIATFLAQEAIELLHHQQDSVFLRCVSQSIDQSSGTSGCPINTTDNSLTTSQISWKIFKSRLSTSSGDQTCFFDENTPSEQGCSFDILDMATNEDNTPTKYQIDSSTCGSLSVDADGLYICSGKASSANSTGTSFSRTVKIESILPDGSITQKSNILDTYDDNLRVTVNVYFRLPNGFIKTISLVDFFHARA